jgi:hypothetical protein
MSYKAVTQTVGRLAADAQSKPDDNGLKCIPSKR